ncbi:unnamed protein product, partial [Didymodactylos carnosus]
MVTFDEPVCGMFIWLKLNGVKDTRKLILEKAVKQEVLLLPGSSFFYDQSKSYPFVRTSYSLSNSEQMDVGMARFAKLLRTEIDEQQQL